MHAVWNLHTQTSQKIGLTITFLTGRMYVGLLFYLKVLIANDFEEA